MGFKHIEFRAPKLREFLYFKSGTEVRKRLKESGVEVVALNSIDDFGLVPDENLGLLRKEAEFIGQMCEAVECPLVIAPVGRWFDRKQEMPVVIEKTVERLDIVGRILKSYGADVGVEPIAFPEFSISSIYDADEVCCQSKEGTPGLIVDYYNLFQGGMEPGDFHKLKSPVHLVHINDADFQPSENLDVCTTRAFPGEGSLDAVDWTVQAIKSGYDGPFSLEIFLKEIWDMEPAVGMYKVVNKLKNFKESVEQRLKEEA